MIKCWKVKASDSDQFMIANAPQETPGWLPDTVTIENQEGYFVTEQELRELFEAGNPDGKFWSFGHWLEMKLGCQC